MKTTKSTFIIQFFTLVFLSFVICGCFGRKVDTTNYNITRVGEGEIFHISDWHVDPFYNSDFDSSTHCRNMSAIKLGFIEDSFYTNTITNKDWWSIQPSLTPNYQFGQYGCDSPRSLADAALVI